MPRYSLREWGAAEAVVLSLDDEARPEIRASLHSLAESWAELVHVREWDEGRGEWVELGESET